MGNQISTWNGLQAISLLLHTAVGAPFQPPCPPGYRGYPPQGQAYPYPTQGPSMYGMEGFYQQNPLLGYPPQGNMGHPGAAPQIIIVNQMPPGAPGSSGPNGAIMPPGGQAPGQIQGAPTAPTNDPVFQQMLQAMKETTKKYLEYLELLTGTPAPAAQAAASPPVEPSAPAAPAAKAEPAAPAKAEAPANTSGTTPENPPVTRQDPTAGLDLEKRKRQEAAGK